MKIDTLAQWHRLVTEHDMAGVDALLSDDAVFYSPVVHTPQVGKPITAKYLKAAFNVFFNDSFRYVNETTGDSSAVLEFTVDIDGIKVNGVDMIKWNDRWQDRRIQGHAATAEGSQPHSPEDGGHAAGAAIASNSPSACSRARGQLPVRPAITLSSVNGYSRIRMPVAL